KPEAEKVVRYAEPFPGSLAGKIATGAAEKNLSSMALGIAGLVGYALLFGGLLFLRFRSQYFGEELSETVAPARTAVRPKIIVREADGPGITFLPATVRTVIGKELRYLFRNGFMAIGLAFPPMLVLLFSWQFGGAHPTALKHGVSPDLFFPGMMAYL